MSATITVRSLNGGNNNHTEPVFSANAFASDFVSPGVVGAITLNTGSGGSGAFMINAEGTPSTQVRIGGSGSDVAYVRVTPSSDVSQVVRVDMNTFSDITIPSNSSGSTKYVWVYIAVDATLARNPDVNATSVGSIVTSVSSSSVNDNGTPPTYGYNLGYITTVNGWTTITNANITDKRTQTGVVAGSFVTAPLTSASNPYKFLAYRNAAWTYTSGIVKAPFDTKAYDTGGNFDAVTNNNFTAPIAGFYKFDTWLDNSGGSGSFTAVTYLYKNGTSYISTDNQAINKAWGVSFPLVQLAAGDTIDVRLNLSVGTQTMGVGSSPILTWLGGYLVSAT